MKSFVTLFKNELKLNIRNMNMVIFAVIASILYFPMLFFSGATLPFEVMPPVIQKIVGIFPLTQGVELMKSAFLGVPIDNMWVPIVIMIAVTMICMSISVRFFKWE